MAISRRKRSLGIIVIVVTILILCNLVVMHHIIQSVLASTKITTAPPLESIREESVSELNVESAVDHILADETRFMRCYSGPTPSSDGTGNADEGVTGQSEILGSGRGFLYYGNDWGRHFNQLQSFIGALGVAYALNRTLIVPPFLLAKQGSGGGGKRPNYDHIPLDIVYDASSLFNPQETAACVLLEHEFTLLESLTSQSLEARRVGRANEYAGSSQKNAAKVAWIKYWANKAKARQYAPAVFQLLSKRRGRSSISGHASHANDIPPFSHPTLPMTIPVLCAKMNGVKLHLQAPKHVTFQCMGTVAISTKKELPVLLRLAAPPRSDAADAWHKIEGGVLNCGRIPCDENKGDTVGWGSSGGSSLEAQHARILTLPLSIYYAGTFSQYASNRLWHTLLPKPLVANAVHRLFSDIDSAHADGARGSATGKQVFITVGIHIRGLEGSCVDRAQGMYRDLLSKTTSTEELQRIRSNYSQLLSPEIQCNFQPAYIRSAVEYYLHRHTAELKRTQSYSPAPRKDSSLPRAPQGRHVHLHFVVADDGQNNERTLGLLKDLTESTFNTPAAFPSIPWIDNVTATFTRLAGMHAGIFSRTAYSDEVHMRAYNPLSIDLERAFWNLYGGHRNLQLDFWALVRTDVFVGVEMSTVSSSICSKRLTIGKTCDNFLSKMLDA